MHLLVSWPISPKKLDFNKLHLNLYFTDQKTDAVEFGVFDMLSYNILRFNS